MTILPAAYLPSVAYFAELLRGNCIIDLGEHFIKRSERNRARILATDGVMELTVQVCHADRPRQPMRDMRLDYSKRWQHQHWGALVASYKGSPYFDFYVERFEPFYRGHWEFLCDYDLQLTTAGGGSFSATTTCSSPSCCARWRASRCLPYRSVMSRRRPVTETCVPNTRRARRSSPSPTCRSFPTACPFSLICLLQTFYLQRGLHPSRF